MVAAKMWARRLMTMAAVVGAGCVASGLAYQAAGAATSLGSLALAH